MEPISAAGRWPTAKPRSTWRRANQHRPRPCWPKRRGRIILAAPNARAFSLAWRWLTGAAIGATMAAACAAGLATGATVGAPALASVRLAVNADAGDEALRLLRDPPDLTEG